VSDLADPINKFVTERTRHMRTTDLSKMDRWAIETIEEHGYALVGVARECEDDFGWTYSLGIYDTCGQPELITVGLPSEVAKSCLNEVTRRMRRGIDVTKERQKELIANVDCELRIVGRKWVRRLMNFSNWYNGDTDYPVLQVIYPDRQNRFQWEEGFENRFIQPLLQPGASSTPIDQQFWESSGKDTERFPNWAFPDKPHTKVFISTAIKEGKEWIAYVTHELSDGAWQIVGETGIESGGPELACLHYVVEKDPTLAELAYLPKGWYAERATPGEPWERFEREPEDADE
jgi:Domain of unknown function (DUF4262)